MSTDPQPSPRNRRRSRRRPAQRGLKAECRRGSLDLGKNLAVAVLDLSEDGARLVLREALREREAVTLWLTSVNTPRPLHCPGTVAWAVPAADGTYCVGVQFDRRLGYADFSRLV